MFLKGLVCERVKAYLSTISSGWSHRRLHARMLPLRIFPSRVIYVRRQRVGIRRNRSTLTMMYSVLEGCLIEVHKRSVNYKHNPLLVFSSLSTPYISRFQMAFHYYYYYYAEQIILPRSLFESLVLILNLYYLVSWLCTNTYMIRLFQGSKN